MSESVPIIQYVIFCQKLQTGSDFQKQASAHPDCNVGQISGQKSGKRCPDLFPIEKSNPILHLEKHLKGRKMGC